MNDSSDRRRPRRLGDSLLALAVEALEDSTGALQLPKLRCSDHHACKLGLEGIVSKRLGSHYRSGRSRDRLKFKNPAAPIVKREAEEEWTSLSIGPESL